MKIFFPRCETWSKKENKYYTRHTVSKFLSSLSKKFEKLFVTANISSEGPEEAELIESEYLEIIEFDARFHPYLENYLWSFGKVSQFKKFQRRSDGVLMTLPSSLKYAKFIPYIKKPLILLIVGSEWGVIRNRDGLLKKLFTQLGDSKLRRIVENSLLKEADGIITRNDKMKNWLEKENKVSSDCQVKVLPAGINTDLFSPVGNKEREKIREDLGIEETDRVIGFVATELSKHKGAYDLKEIFKNILKVKSNVKFLIIGLDNYNIFKNFKKREEVIHHDPVKREKLPDFYNAMDLLVFPATEAEGAPKVLMEASSCEIPCVSTKVAGIPFIIKNGKTGFLTEKNDVENLTKYCKKILDDEKLRRELGKKARKYIKKEFDHDDYISEFSEFVKRVTEENS